MSGDISKIVVYYPMSNIDELLKSKYHIVSVLSAAPFDKMFLRVDHLIMRSIVMAIHRSISIYDERN